MQRICDVISKKRTPKIIVTQMSWAEPLSRQRCVLKAHHFWEAIAGPRSSKSHSSKRYKLDIFSFEFLEKSEPILLRAQNALSCFLTRLISRVLTRLPNDQASHLRAEGSPGSGARFCQPQEPSFPSLHEPQEPSLRSLSSPAKVKRKKTKVKAKVKTKGKRKKTRK